MLLRCCRTPRSISNITGVIPKLIRWNPIYSLGTINDAVFLPGWNKFCNVAGEVKNLNVFLLGVILRNIFSLRNFPERIQLGVLRQVVQKIYFWSLQAYNITYDELPSINVSIHQKQLGFLITEVFESVNNLDPQYLWD